jgi:hypothetical protein
MFLRALLLAALLACGLAALPAPRGAEAAEPVDLALILAVDSSGSVNQQRFMQQRDGYADALASPEVLQAILGGEHRRIAVSYFEWAEPGRIARILPWTLIDGQAAARSASEKIRDHRRQVVGDTCIACAFDEAMAQFASLPWPADRRVLDISGDGESNVGEEVETARERTLAADITVNGLPILTPYEPGLVRYYEERVIGGPGSFLIAARGFEDFARAIAAKMVREIAELPGSGG